MSGAGSSALGRPDRLWPAVVASLAAHALVFAVFGLVRPRPSLDPGQKPIVARLVRLGEPRPKELLPRREAPPPPAAEAPTPAAPEPAPAPAPKAVAVPGEKAPAPKAAAKPGPAEKPGKPAGARLANVLSELKQELQAGRPDGAAGGDAAEAEGDEYLGLVVRQLRQGYRLPSTISERERLFLTGTVVLHIEPDGRIARYELVKRSGNSAFDDALERAVRDTRLPPPPAPLRDLYRRAGLEVVFKI